MIKIIRWITFFPVIAIVYLIFKTVVYYAWMFQSPEFIEEFYLTDSLSGHYVSGIIFIYFYEGISLWIGLYAGLKILPSHNKVVYYILFGMFAAFALFTVIFVSIPYYNAMGMETGHVVRASTELFSWIFAFVAVKKPLEEDL